MTRKEFAERMDQIDPGSAEAVDQLAKLFEEDYISSGRDLSDPAVIQSLLDSAKADLEHCMKQYDRLLMKINGELRKAGATEAQINWGLFGDVELPTLAYLRCNRMAKKLILYSYQISYCLGELKMLGRYADVDEAELRRIRREYGKRFG